MSNKVIAAHTMFDSVSSATIVITPEAVGVNIKAKSRFTNVLLSYRCPGIRLHPYPWARNLGFAYTVDKCPRSTVWFTIHGSSSGPPPCYRDLFDRVPTCTALAPYRCNNSVGGLIPCTGLRRGSTNTLVLALTGHK